MKSIAGIVHFDGASPSREDLSAQLESLSSTHSPKRIIHSLQYAAFGSTGESELLIREDPFLMAATGLLVNHSELNTELDLPPETTIAGTVLAAWKTWGVRALEKLDGDFAFVIWNDHERRLLCARDHLGGEPLYFWSVPGRLFAFASTIEGIVALPEFPRTLNREKVADFLAGNRFQGMEYRNTFYLNAHRLPAASTLTVSKNRTETRRYWALQEIPDTRYERSEEYGQQFRELLLRSLQGRSGNGQRAGLMLSGGLDSGALCTLLQTHSDPSTIQQYIHLYSALDDEERVPEEKEGIDLHHGRWPGKASIIHPSECSGAFEALFHHIEGPHNPFDIFHSTMYFALLQKMREDRVEIALGGADGDLVSSGNPFALADLLRAGRLFECLREIPGYSTHYMLPQWKMLLHFGLLPLSQTLTRLSLLLRTRMNRRFDSDTFQLMNPEFAQETAIFKRANEYEERRGRSRTGREAHAAVLTSPLLQAVRERHDRIGRCSGIPFRQPLFDRRLCEFCVSIPNEEKFFRGIEKRVLRQSLIGLIPESKLHARSYGGSLGSHFQYHFVRRYEEHILSVLHEERERLSEFVLPSALDSLVEKWRKNPVEEKDGGILRLFALAKWLKRHRSLKC